MLIFSFYLRCFHLTLLPRCTWFSASNLSVLTTLLSVCCNPLWSYCTQWGRVFSYFYSADFWCEQRSEGKQTGRERSWEGLEKVSFQISSSTSIFHLVLVLHRGCQTDSHVPGGGGGPLAAGPHSQLPTTLCIWWEFHHSPWHHTNGDPQKDSWGLPRHRCLWGTGLQPDCELESHAETEKLVWEHCCIQIE